MSLRIITGRELPVLGWIGAEPLSRDRFDPVSLMKTELVDGLCKAKGGLWTSPLVYSAFEHRLRGTQWSVARDVDSFTVLRAKRTARIVVVDSQADLTAVEHRWPDTRPSDYLDWCKTRVGRREDYERESARIDWTAMARDVDAFYLTSAGQLATKDMFGDGGGPHLWGWDVATVFWLQPRFYLGPTVRVTQVKDATQDAVEEAVLDIMLAIRETPDAVAGMVAKFEASEVGKAWIAQLGGRPSGRSSVSALKTS